MEVLLQLINDFGDCQATMDGDGVAGRVWKRGDKLADLPGWKDLKTDFALGRSNMTQNVSECWEYFCPLAGIRTDVYTERVAGIYLPNMGLAGKRALLCEDLWR